MSDLLAAQAVGAIPVLVKTGKGSQTMNDNDISSVHNLMIFEDLHDFTNFLMH